MYFRTELGRDNSTIINVTSPILQFNITDLKPFTNYSILLSAITIKIGNESEVITVLTNETGKLTRYIEYYT